MLIEVAKIGPEVLRMCLMIEILEAIEYQRQVDDKSEKQRSERKQEKEDQYLGSGEGSVLPGIAEASSASGLCSR